MTDLDFDTIRAALLADGLLPADTPNETLNLIRVALGIAADADVPALLAEVRRLTDAPGPWIPARRTPMAEPTEVKDLAGFRRYDVEFDDCCVTGAFTATITELDRDDDYVYDVRFDNGVRLTNCLGVTFTEVDHA